MPPSDPSSDGAQAPSLPAESGLAAADLTTVDLVPHARAVEETARRLSAVQERLRASVNTPEMRRLAEGLRKVLEEERKQFEPLAKAIADEQKRWEPFAKEAERVQREMRLALEESGLGKRIDEIQKELWSPLEADRAAEVIRRIQEESGLVSREAVERLEESGVLSADDAAEIRRRRGWNQRPMGATGTNLAPVPPCDAPPRPAAPAVPQSPQVAPLPASTESPGLQEAGPTVAIPGIQEMVKAAVAEVLQTVFPPEFASYVTQRMGRPTDGEAESGGDGVPPRVLAPPEGWCGPGRDMGEAATRLGFKSRRSLKSYLEYSKVKGRDPKGLEDFFAGGSGRTPDGKFREDALAAYEAARKRLPEMERALAEGATERALKFGKTAARKLPYTGLERLFGRHARE